jgi:hypothetical protein
MPDIKFTNNAKSFLAANISDSETAIVVATGDGPKFPALGVGDFFYATIEEVEPVDPLDPVSEIIKVTARSGDTMTASRGQDGTTARAWFGNDKFELRLPAAAIAALRRSQFGILMHTAVINEDLSIDDGYNGVSGGPVTIADGATVTVPTGSTWTIV